jgi:hypothetical protein
MKQYIVGFKWKDGREDYLTIQSSDHPTNIAKEFKDKDQTGNLEVVYVKLKNGK